MLLLGLFSHLLSSGKFWTTRRPNASQHMDIRFVFVIFFLLKWSHAQGKWEENQKKKRKQFKNIYIKKIKKRNNAQEKQIKKHTNEKRNIKKTNTLKKSKKKNQKFTQI